jgi:hypothetical protein
MQLRVHEQDNEVHIELRGVAGRQERVLFALMKCHQGISDLPAPSDAQRGAAVSVRSGSNQMHIRLRGDEMLQFDPVAIYRCLRRLLVEEHAIQAPNTSVAHSPA